MEGNVISAKKLPEQTLTIEEVKENNGVKVLVEC